MDYSKHYSRLGICPPLRKNRSQRLKVKEKEVTHHRDRRAAQTLATRLAIGSIHTWPPRCQGRARRQVKTFRMTARAP